MCLVTDQLRPKVAKRDITCYKIMYRNLDVNKRVSVFHSLFRGFEYRIGVNYKEELFCTCRPPGENIHKGFHSYRNIEFAQKAFYFSCVLVKCVIPEGAMYYEGGLYGDDRQQYCSNEIRIVAWRPVWRGEWKDN